MEDESRNFNTKYESCVDPTLQLSEKFLESKNVTWSALNKEMITVRINDFHFAPKVRKLQPIRSERQIAVMHGLHAQDNAGIYSHYPGKTSRFLKTYREYLRELTMTVN
jgi:hypothetical protein